MAKDVKYTIFKTKWGYFGLAANEKGLIRTVLPSSAPNITKKYLVADLDNPKFDKNLLKPLQNKIIAYFEGRLPSFLPLHAVGRGVLRLPSSVPLALDHLPPFTKKVLAACKKIPSGQTVSYSQLARKIGKPKASRAVGTALAKNPIPLIIPCHRIIRCDGSPSQFSAVGGKMLKLRLLLLEGRSSR